MIAWGVNDTPAVTATKRPELLRHYLHGDRAIKPSVPCLKDFAQTAHSDRHKDLIRTDFVTYRKEHTLELTKLTRSRSS